MPRCRSSRWMSCSAATRRGRGSGAARRRRSTPYAGMSFEVERGELFGLLGPNGAGKTTTIKMLITLLLPTGGHCQRPRLRRRRRDAREIRRRVGYVFGGDRGLYERLSGPRQPPLLQRAVRRTGTRAEGPDRRAAGAGGPDRPRARAGRGLLARHAAAPAHRARPAAPAGGPLPRRAEHRHRPRRGARAAHDGRGSRRARHDRAAHHALHVRGRRAVRPHRGDRRRADRGRRAPRPSSSAVSSTGASSRSRSTGRPTMRSRRSGRCPGCARSRSRTAARPSS